MQSLYSVFDTYYVSGWCGVGQFLQAQPLIVSPQLQQSGAYYLVITDCTQFLVVNFGVRNRV